MTALFNLLAVLFPLTVLQAPSQLILVHNHPHGHEVPIKDPGYDEAARQAGFSAWGRLDDNGSGAHVVLRLNRDSSARSGGDEYRAVLGVALDNRLGEEKIKRWATHLAQDMGWKIVERLVEPQAHSTYVFLQSDEPVEIPVPGESAAVLSLPVLRRSLERITRLPVPLAVRCPDAGWEEASPAPAAVHTAGRNRYLFYLLDDSLQTGVIQVKYGLEPSRFGGFALSLLAWLLLPFGVAAAVRTLLFRLRRASRPLFAKWCWVLSPVLLLLLLAGTLPAAAAVATELAPPAAHRLVWGLWIIPFALPLFLTAMAVTGVGFDMGREDGAPAPPWHRALARPVFFSALILALGLGAPATFLLGGLHLALALAAVGVPLLLAAANLAAPWFLVQDAGAPGGWRARLRWARAAAEPAGDSPLARRVLPALAALVGLAALALCAFLFLTRSLPLCDFGWQVKTGELIFRQGRIPRADSFSWTSTGQPFVVQEWLPNVLFYLAYSRLPHWVLILYKTLLGLAAIMLVFGRAWLRSRSYWMALGATLVCAGCLQNLIDIRPGMFTFMLVAALMWGLDAYREGRARRLPWLLPPMFAVWANLHGGVVVGFALLFLWIGGLWLGRLLRREAVPPLRPLVIGALAAVAAAGLNPSGFGILVYPFWVLSHPTVTDRVLEWLSPSFHEKGWLVYEVLLLGTLALFGFSRRRSLADLLVLVAVAHASLGAVRNVALFTLVAAPFLAEGATVFLSRARRQLAPFRFGVPARVMAAVGALVVLVAATWQVRPRVAPGQWFQEYGAMNTFPEEAAQRLAAGAWPGRLYNDYGWGGYLIWKLYPARQVFADGRAEVHYQTHAFDDSIEIGGGAATYQSRLDRWGIQTILTQKDGPLAQRLDESKSGQWKKVFTGKREAVYVRSDSQKSDLTRLVKRETGESRPR
jgi:hypothetical protein